MVKKEYIDFTKTTLDGVKISLVIKEGKQTVESLRRKEKVTKSISLIFTYIIVTFLALVMILPFYWMIIT